MDGGAGVPPGHRPFRPPPGEPVAWPDSFGRRFTIFCDVEEEFDWSAPLDAGRRSTAAIRAFPAAHARFAGLGVGLTCMVDYPVATDARAVDILRAGMEDARCAVGAQLHAWVNPPLDGPVNAFASFPGNLSRETERAKLTALTDAIEQAFGLRPLAYRAGRYGIGPNTLALLADAGYRLDSSVRSRYDYSAEGGPDFSDAGNAAHRHDGVLELPLTTVFTGWARRRGPALYHRLGRAPHARGAAARTGMLSRVALTPEGMPLRDVLRALDVATGDERLLAFSFHSPSLVPGHTPYVRDAADLAVFWRWWDGVLSRLDRLGVRYATLAEILAAAERPPYVAPRP